MSLWLAGIYPHPDLPPPRGKALCSARFVAITFLDRQIVKMVKSLTGDLRDWDAIRAWGQGVYVQLVGLPRK